MTPYILHLVILKALIAEYAVNVEFCELKRSLVHTFFLHPDTLGTVTDLSKSLAHVVNWEWSDFFDLDQFDTF